MKMKDDLTGDIKSEIEMNDLRMKDLIVHWHATMLIMVPKSNQHKPTKVGHTSWGKNPTRHATVTIKTQHSPTSKGNNKAKKAKQTKKNC
jgi:hypothetical protein